MHILLMIKTRGQWYSITGLTSTGPKLYFYYVAGMNSSMDGSQISKGSSPTPLVQRQIVQLQNTQLDVVSRSGHEHSRLGQGDNSSDAESPPGRASATSSGMSTPVHVVHPSLGESWLVTPPPCFTAGGPSPQGMGTHPLEDLLIEHPSMSVYGPRGRPQSVGHDSEDSSAEDVRPAAGQPGQQAGRAVAPHHRPRTITTAKASLQAQVMVTRSMQKAHKKHEQRRHTRNAIERSNRVQHYNAHSRRQRRKEHMVHPSGRNNCRKTHQH